MAAVASHYRPNFGDLPQLEASRLLDASRMAMRELDPVFLHNRQANATTLEAMQHGGVFPSLYTSPNVSIKERLIRIPHRIADRLRFVYGGGADAGHTIFATVQFRPRGAVVDGVDGAKIAQRGLTDAVDYGGPLSLQLSQIPTDRLTITAGDSFLANTMAAPISRLPEVIAERFARDFGFIDDIGASATQYRASEITESVATRRARLLELLHRPTDEVANVLREQLQSPRFSSRLQFIEAQVRRGEVSDIASVHVVGPVANEYESQLRRASAELNIPVYPAQVHT